MNAKEQLAFRKFWCCLIKEACEAALKGDATAIEFFKSEMWEFVSASLFTKPVRNAITERMLRIVSVEDAQVTERRVYTSEQMEARRKQQREYQRRLKQERLAKQIPTVNHHIIWPSHSEVSHGIQTA
jgi:hypothetical protein